MQVKFKNRFTIIFIIVLLNFIFTNYVFASGSWSALGTTGFSVGSTNYISMAIDSNDVKYTAFSDGANSDKATVMKYNGSTWELVGTAGFSAGTALQVSLAIDSGDIPYVVFVDGANSDKATVMKYNGSTWELVGTAGFSAGTANYTKIHLSTSNEPHIFFSDGANSDKATVMKYNGSTWELVGTAGFSAGNALYGSLAMDSNNNPYVSYVDYDAGEFISVMKYNGSTWELVGTAGFSADYIYRHSQIVIDSNDIPYVAYADGGNGERSTVMKYNGSTWELVGTAGFSPDGVAKISLALDSSNIPYVGFVDYAGYSDIYSKATVMKYNGSTWELVGTAGFSTDSVDYTSVAIDSNNSPYIAYMDNSVSNKATVMKFFSGLKTISSFTISGDGSVNENNKTVTINLVCGTNVSNLTPLISTSSLSSVSPLSGVAIDFTNPVTYTVTAEDNTTQDYVVTVNVSLCAQSSGSSAGSRARNLISMGKVDEAQQILNQFPNAINELQKTNIPTPVPAVAQPVSSNFIFKNNIKLSWSENFINPEVKILQEFLNTQGYNLKPDSKFGPLTHYAVKDFQVKHYLNPDGIVGLLTKMVINSIITNKNF